jgi:acyl-CoA synthetase (AMP-forming)/AMP-acid ligase II
MNASRAERPSLSSLIPEAGAKDRWLWDGVGEANLASAIGCTRLSGGPHALRGRTVLVRTRDQLTTALILIELDGVAGRLVLCPPDLDPRHLPFVAEEAGADALVGEPFPGAEPRMRLVDLSPPTAKNDRAAGEEATEWVLFTSGTTGRPKMVAHTLQGLVGAIAPSAAQPPPIWGTFYDIRRYGGLQMLLRALIGGGSMILSRSDESVADFLGRLAERGASHVSATPSHWRQALMSPALGRLAPRYVRLSGEIADQALLDRLKARFPGVPVGHAYASTEAGVGFEVNDGLEGFPAAFLARPPPEVEMLVQDGSLRLRSSRTASGYVGAAPAALRDEDGFVDTGDMVERRADRFYFVGRRGGVINVGGLKVHPEEVEAVINRHPRVRMCRVSARRSPITGALAMAEVLAEEGAAGEPLKAEILEACRAELAPFKVPASVRFVEALEVTAGGKLERSAA